MSRAGIAMFVVLGCGAVAAVVFGSLWSGVHLLGGHAEHASFTRDGTRLVIVDRSRSRSSSVPRVRVHDPRTGAELIRAGLGTGFGKRDTSVLGEINCIPAASALVWCHDWSGSDGLSLRRLDTLAVVADEERIRRTTPALADGIMRDRFGRAAAAAVDPGDGALLVLASDGRYYRIGTELLVRSEPQLPPGAVDFERGGSRATTQDADFGDHKLRLAQESPGQKRSVINIAVAGSPNWGGEAAHPQQSFLDAGFVTDGDSGKALRLANPPGALLAHYEPKDGDRQLILTRVDAAGVPGWSATLRGDPALAARLVGDTLVVVLRDALVGLDPQTGAVRYDREL